MYSGHPSLCLKVRELERSTGFYSALGFAVVEEVPGVRVVLRRGHFRLALMTFLDEDVLNLRGADVSSVFDTVTAALPGLEGKPVSYRAEDLENRADADGTSWFTRDPDGHAILFDTNRHEEGEAARAERIATLLRDTEEELRLLDADPALLETFRAEIVAKFIPN